MNCWWNTQDRGLRVPVLEDSKLKGKRRGVGIGPCSGNISSTCLTWPDIAPSMPAEKGQTAGLYGRRIQGIAADRDRDLFEACAGPSSDSRSTAIATRPREDVERYGSKIEYAGKIHYLFLSPRTAAAP